MDRLRVEGCGEGSGGELLGGQAEDVTVGAPALEGPGEVRLGIDAQVATGRREPHQDRHGVGALGSTREQAALAQLCHLAFILPISGRS